MAMIHSHFLNLIVLLYTLPGQAKKVSVTTQCPLQHPVSKAEKKKMNQYAKNERRKKIHINHLIPPHTLIID